MRRAFPEHVEFKGAIKTIVGCKPQGHSNCMFQVKLPGKTAERHATPELQHICPPCRDGSHDPFGADQKYFERREFEEARYPGVPLVVRLDAEEVLRPPRTTTVSRIHYTNVNDQLA